MITAFHRRFIQSSDSSRIDHDFEVYFLKKGFSRTPGAECQVRDQGNPKYTGIIGDFCCTVKIAVELIAEGHFDAVLIRQEGATVKVKYLTEYNKVHIPKVSYT